MKTLMKSVALVVTMYGLICGLYQTHQSNKNLVEMKSVGQELPYYGHSQIQVSSLTTFNRRNLGICVDSSRVKINPWFDFSKLSKKTKQDLLLSLVKPCKESSLVKSH